MSRNLDSPVQTQMAVAVAVCKSSLGRECHNRRVFVQTETGRAVGMELDRSDSVHTVKRRLQVALNFPTEESSLTFGDKVLENDLSANLLTRGTMQRSSSTPCLSPTGKEVQQRDQSSCPVEILGQSSRFSKTTQQLVKEIVKAIKAGIEPLPSNGGLGGGYYFRNIRGQKMAIVKPADEEPFAPNNPNGFVGRALGQPGLKSSVRVGETGFREVAAYLLDYDQFATVPPTALVKITHSIFNVNDGAKNGNKKRLVSKTASLQQFVPHDFDANDHGPSSFPVASVHRIGILDVRIFNTDRHAGNILVRKLDGVGRFGQMELIPIDHGLCLPESLEDPYFEWIHWPQASIPFSEDELQYIDKLDPLRDSEMLRSELPMIHESCLRVLVLCTIFLKEAAAFGLCLAEIGKMMSRDFRSSEEEPSGLEVVCIHARKLVSEREILSPNDEGDDEQEEVQFDIDCEEYDDTPKLDSSELTTKNPFHLVLNGCSLLSKLEEGDEEEEEENDVVKEEQNFTNVPFAANCKTISNLSKSLKNTYFGEKIPKHYPKFPGAKPDNNNLISSVNEQLHTSVNFVKLADMNEEEWAMFLEKFRELLIPAFTELKSLSLAQRQLQRLGTSCQF